MKIKTTKSRNGYWWRAHYKGAKKPTGVGRTEKGAVLNLVGMTLGSQFKPEQLNLLGAQLEAALKLLPEHGHLEEAFTGVSRIFDLAFDHTNLHDD